MFNTYSYIDTGRLHSPGIEPGTTDWKSAILPLNYECFNRVGWGGKGESELPESNRRPFDNL